MIESSELAGVGQLLLEGLAGLREARRRIILSEAESESCVRLEASRPVSRNCED